MTLEIGALTKLGLFFPVLCFIRVFHQTLTEQLYRDKGLLVVVFVHVCCCYICMSCIEYCAVKFSACYAFVCLCCEVEWMYFLLCSVCVVQSSECFVLVVLCCEIEWMYSCTCCVACLCCAVFWMFCTCGVNVWSRMNVLLYLLCSAPCLCFEVLWMSCCVDVCLCFVPLMFPAIILKIKWCALRIPMQFLKTFFSLFICFFWKYTKNKTKADKWIYFCQQIRVINSNFISSLTSIRRQCYHK